MNKIFALIFGMLFVQGGVQAQTEKEKGVAPAALITADAG